MKRLWRRSLAAQFLCFALVSLLLSQVAAFTISWDEHGHAMRKLAKGEMLNRSASLVRVLEATPAELQGDILAASNTSKSRYWITEATPGSATTWRSEAWSQLTEPVARVLYYGFAMPNPVQAATSAPEGGSPDWLQVPPEAWPLARPAQFLYLDDRTGMGVTVQLANGSWLNAAMASSAPENFWNSRTLTGLTISALILSILAVIAARSIARPMRSLAKAAEALGRGQHVTPLPEAGPDDIRRTVEAFNRMQERLTRFVEDRTRMLAAIGHDLRTPLTSLRLRAEFVQDDELREKILDTAAEIQSMVEATLSFVREEGTAEETRTVDLPALLGSLCEDMAELGHQVTFAEAERLGYRCRPAALRRACRNLIENAVRYGECARVSVERYPHQVRIVVEDDGPGIPWQERERAFAPFYRLENSRNRETGGVGLGLSIARTIARHHGGDVMLTSSERGFRAIIVLPALDMPEGQPPLARMEAGSEH
ncbi:ATPase/histidine kinase/DNA gyrase B/HSP90 domain protein [Acetobacteraceae bacterium AT-5844]|nr:ATPase/histidine kinase/DNA gyrase B/HSP90 domain protein [Acetobacteraceae bacterium AT-5844]